MRTLTLAEIESIYDAPKKLAKFAFESIKPTLIDGVDYKTERNSIKLSLSGCMFLADKMYGATDSMEARRCIIELLTEEEPAPPADPFVVIEEQLALLRNRINPESTTTILDDILEQITPSSSESKDESEDASKTEEDIRAYKERRIADKRKEDYERQQASNEEIRSKVNSTDGETWRKEMSKLVREITIYRGTTFSTTIKEIYIKMRNKYGFVSDQCIKDYMNKYGLEIKPSTLNAVSDNETWKSIFKCIAEDMLAEAKSKN